MNLEILLTKPNLQIDVNGSSILRSNRNRYGRGVACCLRFDLCFNSKNIFSNSIEHVFFFYLITYSKSEAYFDWYFNRSPNVNTFLETFFNDLKHSDFHKNEVCFLGDFNANLLLNDKFILKEKQSPDFRNLGSQLVSKYKELYIKIFLKRDHSRTYSRNKQNFLPS